VIVDLNCVAPEQQALVSQYYHGYIPTITAIDSKGHVIYDRAEKPIDSRRHEQSAAIARFGSLARRMR
jgi:hypothetical protein